jgi:hypothetical protein
VCGVHLLNTNTSPLILAQADPDPIPTVYISRKTFEVKNLKGAAEFLRAMYNCKAFVKQADCGWDAQQELLCAQLQRYLADLPSFSSKTPHQTKKSGVNSNPHRMPSIAEAGEELALLGYNIDSFDRLVRNQLVPVTTSLTI